MSKYPFPHDIKLMFSGHETFSLRQLWLKKAHEQTLNNIKVSEQSAPKSVFSNDDAIERFGVGKNMVASIKHWALACDVIKDSNEDSGIEIGEIGKFLFGCATQNAQDEFLEQDASLWLIHWLLSGRASRTPTLYAIFNFIQNQTFNTDDILNTLNNSSAFSTTKKSKTTLIRDIETCIRCYTASHDSEDSMDSLLGSLELVSSTAKSQYRFNIGTHESLHDAVFAFGLLDFWDRWEQETGASQRTLSFSAVAHWYNSPGRVFKLSEDAVADRLSRIAEITNNYLTWTDQTGTRQVARVGSTPLEESKMAILRGAYA